MLARLSLAASRTFVSAIEVGGQCSTTGDEREVLSLNVEELCQLVRPLPYLAWGTVSDICTRTIVPVYSALSSTLHDDVEGLAQLFVELETAAIERDAYFEPVERDVLPTRLKRCQSTESVAPLPSLPPSVRRRSTVRRSSNPVVIENDDPSIPTIVITPCPSLPREVACLVPYQDAAFGNRLPVPTHPVLNDVYPPLVAKPFPLVERWRYEDGHWHAQLPPVQEQMSKGMFSRPLSTRRQRAIDMARARTSRGRTVYSRSSHREG
ncbi:hypothetical protein L226DRAFT_528328 [Lentinus tigrinus ALCF2SS1-7]|uniref:Uncharacterized protein n=1 Tax=Lentinus tigrinus ALCF2SS1-6 TaxID=1328759 RepID=A0A5C2SMH6_9APHY|nr:hypothetical protein L227DRAFT_541547 [Lentinus tigrinus ALCF2SS1-6]RPD82129.1 hypothetical protein L226DRAFT_528328 [Lentinus tigrinus ALCF2SS1-7]